MESRRGNSKNSFGMSGVVSLDSLIGQSLANISQSDREQTYFDLHGVTVPVTETPNFITESLQQMQSTLDGIKDKPAYDLAYSMDAEYVQDLKFRLKFLRGERFDTRMAAKRMVRYFQIKEDLFNSSKLCKDIDQSDMSEEDIDALYGGWMQHMTEKDSSGRMVLLWFAGAKARKISVLSGMRVCFYLRMLALEDIEVQKKGFVAIALEDNERQNDFVSSKIQSGARLLNGLPGSIVGIHICSWQENSLKRYIFSLVSRLALLTLSTVMKVRSRNHIGSSREDCLANLQTFGIPVHAMPKHSDESIRHNNMLRKRRIAEFQRNRGQSTPRGGVCMPGPKDVILGRGKARMSHPGNIQLRCMIEEDQHNYESTFKNLKKGIVQGIVDEIKKSGGRFLKEEDTRFFVVSDKVAFAKVSHNFRYLRGLKSKPDCARASKCLRIGNSTS